MDSDESYPYGWAPKGERCEAKKPGNRNTRERINLVAGLKSGTMLAPVVFKGYCDGTFFLEWLEKALIPAFIKGDTAILDNAAFHPKEKIIALLEAAGCLALFLPRYSPQDNKACPRESGDRTRMVPHQKCLQKNPRNLHRHQCSTTSR